MARTIVSLKYGELLPANDPVSPWLLAVCSAASDAAHAMLGFLGAVGELEEEGSENERPLLVDSLCYYLRLAFAHTIEGFEHALLQAKDSNDRRVYRGHEQAIRTWIAEDHRSG